jgi:hypothetical protein
MMPPDITLSSNAPIVTLTLEAPREMKLRKRARHGLKQSMHSESSAANPGYDQGPHRHGTPFIDIDLEHWDYANISESDAKQMA